MNARNTNDDAGQPDGCPPAARATTPAASSTTPAASAATPAASSTTPARPSLRFLWLSLAVLGAQSPVGDAGLMSFDPELAKRLDALTDDSNVNAAVVYHHPVTDSDIATLKALGVRGGTRFRQPFHRIVVGKRDRVRPGARGEFNQLRGSQQTIRTGRMIVQVVIVQRTRCL